MNSSIHRETITLIKRNGQTFDGIQANVQPTQIFTLNADAPVEEGDIIRRVLPNRLEERYIVIDRGFYSQMRHREAHYQMKVRKETSLTQHPLPQGTYNLHGHNSRVNNQAVDLSTNTVTFNPNDVFLELKRAIELHVPHDGGQDVLLQEVSAMEDTRGTEEYLPQYQKFIQAAANHMTLVAPFIPMLTQFLK